MQKILRKLVEKEMDAILNDNRKAVRELVQERLVPELRKLIYEELDNAFGALAKQAVSEPAPEPPKTASHLIHAAKERLPSDDILPGGKYLYAVVQATEEQIGLGKIGIEGEAVYTIRYQDLAAVVHDCPARPYQSEDREKVVAWVQAHQDVVETAWKRWKAVVPAAFDTIILADKDGTAQDNLTKWLKEAYDDLQEKMETVSGKAEYGVQLFWHINQAARRISGENVSLQEMEAKIQSKPKGAAYMYRKQLENLLKKEMKKAAEQNTKAFFQQIEPIVDQIKIEKTKAAENTDHQMLMNLACLLPQEKSIPLGEALETFNEKEGFFVKYTGPWPPYSFV